MSSSIQSQTPLWDVFKMVSCPAATKDAGCGANGGEGSFLGLASNWQPGLRGNFHLANGFTLACDSMPLSHVM